MKWLEQDLGELDTPPSRSELSLFPHTTGKSSALTLHPALAAQQGYWSRGAPLHSWAHIQRREPLYTVIKQCNDWKQSKNHILPTWSHSSFLALGFVSTACTSTLCQPSSSTALPHGAQLFLVILLGSSSSVTPGCPPEPHAPAACRTAWQKLCQAGQPLKLKALKLSQHLP